MAHRRTSLGRSALLLGTVGLVVGLGCSSSPASNNLGGSQGDDAAGGGAQDAQGAGNDGTTGNSSGSSGGSGGSNGATGPDGSSGTGGPDGGGARDASADASADAPGINPEAGIVTAGDAGACPAAPSGIDANTAAAYQLESQTRAAMGSPCATLVPALDTSAANHCAYYAANKATASCVANAHVEVSGCTSFVAAQFGARETAAGYTGRPASETMAFDDNGARAVQTWIDSVWHRTPILSPWVRDAGYGSATGCDTMDFGAGAATSKSVVLTYPYDGQTGVPVSFDGSREGPVPPVPPGGWPSGYPVTVFVSGASGTALTTHEFSVDGGALIAHQWVTPQTTGAVIQDAVVLYANAPLTSATRYRVHVAGTGYGGAAVNVNVTFTTK
jgi:hypothetical protein